VVYTSMGQPTKALETIETLLGRNPNDPKSCIVLPTYMGQGSPNHDAACTGGAGVGVETDGVR